MKRYLLIQACGMSLLFFLALSPQAHADNSVNREQALLLKGELIAQEITKATGCAISPILGISVLGAYTYYTTPPEQRLKVRWYARPFFWAPLLAVLLAIIVKDSSKIALPKIVVMPIDAVENLLEKNVSAVLGLLVILSSMTEKGVGQLLLSEVIFSLLETPVAAAADGVATTVNPSMAFELAGMGFLLTLVFILVWVTSQSFNFLIFLCPFSWLDLVLTFWKNSLILMLLGAFLIHPYAGLAFSSLIILFSLVIFLRSLRFVRFGIVFSSDIVFSGRRKSFNSEEPVKGFSGFSVPGVPWLSYGAITDMEGNLTFRFRSFPFLPVKDVVLENRTNEYAAGKGTLFPAIVSVDRGQSHKTMFYLRPRYTSHEKEVAAALNLDGVRDTSMGSSVRDVFLWLREQFFQLTRLKSAEKAMEKQQ